MNTHLKIPAKIKLMNNLSKRRKETLHLRKSLKKGTLHLRDCHLTLATTERMNHIIA